MPKLVSLSRMKCLFSRLETMSRSGTPSGGPITYIGLSDLAML
jgi:hypothetical protein